MKYFNKDKIKKIVILDENDYVIDTCELDKLFEKKESVIYAKHKDNDLLFMAMASSNALANFAEHLIINLSEASGKSIPEVSAMLCVNACRQTGFKIDLDKLRDDEK